MDEIVKMQSNGDAVVDIFFIGDPVEQNVRDWEDSFGPSDWFKETLPKVFIRTRSLYYRYKTSSSRDSIADNISHAAHRLLSEFAKLETNSSVRPFTGTCDNTVVRSRGPSRSVIFVCQSSGGHVVEEALRLSETYEELHGLASQTWGIVFLGTPHPISAQKPNASLLDTPDHSDRIHSNTQSMRIQDIDEQPTQPTAGNHWPDRPYVLHPHCLSSMVPQYWLLERAENHYLIPKSLSEESTRANIERSISRLSEEATRSHDHCRKSLESERSLQQMCLRERSAATCEWLFNLQAYRNWSDEAESPLLWLKGRPGAGKSILASSIVENLEVRQGPRCAVAFCFFDSRQIQVSSARYILEAFAYQLREHVKFGVPNRRLCSIIGEADNAANPMSLEQFQRRLRAVFLSVDKRAKVFLILDGLDDDEGVQKVILHEILRVNRPREKPHIFKCIMSSRFACEARHNPQDIIQIDLNTESGVQQDMVNFATTRLANVFTAPSKQVVSFSAFAEQLCSRANGNFLWVALAIEDIHSMESRSDMQRLLGLLPASVDAFYQRTLQKIPSQDVVTAQKVFSWLTAANRHLYLPELLEALVVEADRSQLLGQPLPIGNELNSSNIQAEIRRVCGWLVTITEEGIVRLRHPTLRDYLLFANDSSKQICHPVLAAHELLARACLVLLGSVRKLETCSALPKRNPAQQYGRGVTSTLTGYAAANWHIHYRLSETYSRILAGTLQRCLVITLDYDCQSFSIPKSGRSIQIANATLRISASFGLVSLTELCLDMGMDADGGSCSLCESPLSIAVGGGHLEVANILMQGSTLPVSKMSDNLEAMIHFAVARGLTDAAESLLKCGSNVDAVELQSGKTVLHVAAESGKVDMVILLMAYNANVNATVPTTQEAPLHLAAAQGYTNVIKYLVDGRDPSVKEMELYDSILHQPFYQSWTEDLLTNEKNPGRVVWEVDARNSAEEHIGWLRSCSTRYSNINLRTSGGRTALDIATSKGYNDVVRFLLERGAELENKASSRCTALQGAIENGHLETVKLLLMAGATMHQQTEGLVPTLQRACKEGHHDVAAFVVWYCFNTEISAEDFSWSVMCLPTKTTNALVRDTIQKEKLHTKFTKHGTHNRFTHNRFAQRLKQLAERPKD